jgi:hypothetical protein
MSMHKLAKRIEPAEIEEIVAAIISPKSQEVHIYRSAVNAYRRRSITPWFRSARGAQISPKKPVPGLMVRFDP